MVEKATLIVLTSGQQIPVMYNPTELSLAKSVQTSGEGANIQFKRVVDDDFTVSLFFDSFDKKTDVRTETNRILDLTRPTVDKGTRKWPPEVAFTWGGTLFKGLITRVDQKFTMFLPTGIPVRAELTVTFKAVQTDAEHLASEGKPNCRKSWLVCENDRLYLIAGKALGDASRWREIATENNIYDPLSFPLPSDIGRTLMIRDHTDTGTME